MDDDYILNFIVQQENFSAYNNSKNSETPTVVHCVLMYIIISNRYWFFRNKRCLRGTTIKTLNYFYIITK